MSGTRRLRFRIGPAIMRRQFFRYRRGRSGGGLRAPAPASVRRWPRSSATQGPPPCNQLRPSWNFAALSEAAATARAYEGAAGGGRVAAVATRHHLRRVPQHGRKDSRNVRRCAPHSLLLTVSTNHDYVACHSTTAQRRNFSGRRRKYRSRASHTYR